jgi:hypothetical protein
VLDTIHPRGVWLAGADTTAFRRRYAPTEDWFALPDGRVVITRTDKVGFLLDDPRGGARPLVAEHPVARNRYAENERKEMQANIALMQRPVNIGGEHLPSQTHAEVVPEFGPVMSRASADLSGRVWIVKVQPRVKGERNCAYSVGIDDGPMRCMAWTNFSAPGTQFYDAFQLDGAYLGEVRFPVRARSMSFFGDFAWAIAKDADDADVLARFRIRR